jgi:hypothetical protein
LPTVDPILRYVSPDNQFVTEAAQADRVWLPKIVVRKHHRTKVLLFPATAAIEDAQAAIVTDYCTLSDAIARWPDTVGKMTTEELSQLASWRPSFADMVVPFTFRGGEGAGMTGPSLEQVGTLSPLMQKRMFFHRLYVLKSSGVSRRVDARHLRRERWDATGPEDDGVRGHTPDGREDDALPGYPVVADHADSGRGRSRPDGLAVRGAL